MSNNIKKDVAVIWDKNTINTGKIGSFIYKGTVKGYAPKVVLVLKVTSLSSSTPTSKQRFEAEDAKLVDTMVEESTFASKGKFISYMDQIGRSVTFKNAPKARGFTIGYTRGNEGPGIISLYLNNIHNQDLTLPNTGGWVDSSSCYKTYKVVLDIPAGTNIKFQFDSSDEPINIDYIDMDLDASTQKSQTIPHSGMSASVSSANLDYPASNAIDDNSGTFWHTEWEPMPNPALPQSITLNLGGKYKVVKLRYLPRQEDGDRVSGAYNGIITQYKVYVSTDGSSFTQVANGKWTEDKTEKSVTFNATSAAYVKLEAIQAYGNLVSAAEINIEYDLGG